MSRVGFWGYVILYNCIEEPTQSSIGNYLGPYNTILVIRLPYVDYYDKFHNYSYSATD